MERRGRGLEVSERAREQVLSTSRSRALPHSLVRRARIVLMASDGHTNQQIAAPCEVTSPAITHGATRFIAHGPAGLPDGARPRWPRARGDEAVAPLLARVLHGKPRGATHWRVRSAAAQTGISTGSAARYLSLFGVQPLRSKRFRRAPDPYLIEKVRHIVGLYLSPPTNAWERCVDETSRCQALGRTQPMVPMVPMGLGQLEGVAHDDGRVRHGTTPRFAARNAATGGVIAQCKSRHRHQECLAFPNRVDQAVPQALDVHLIVEDYTTRQHPQDNAWRANRSRYCRHFTPTYSSGLNQVERQFWPDHAAGYPARLL